MGVFSMQADQMGGEFIARSALRVTEDQEYAPAPVLLERNHATMKVGQEKNRRARAGFESTSPDTGKNQPAVKHASPPLASHAGLDSHGGGHTLDYVPKPDLLFDKESGEVHSVRREGFSERPFAVQPAALRRALAGPGSARLKVGHLQG
jgi:hypothetical protein